MICLSCGHDNPDGRTFCVQCSNKLPKRLDSAIHGETEAKVVSARETAGRRPASAAPAPAPQAAPAPQSRPARPAAAPVRAAAPAGGAREEPGEVLYNLKEEKGFFRVGDVLDGRYELVEIIGQGNVGVAFKAHDTQGRKVVAVKALYNGVCRSRDLVANYLREIAAWRGVKDPHMVQVLATGEMGAHYFVMEYMKVPPLEKVIRERTQKGRGFEFAEVLPIVQQVAEGLAAVPGRAAHRNLKPANLFFFPSGAVKISDPGMATIVPAAQLASNAKFLGCLAYIAPEVRARPGSADVRADVYALGVLVYHMMTGRLPDAAMTPPSQAAKGLPASLDELFAAAASPDPFRRMESAEQFLHEFARAFRAPTKAAAAPAAAPAPAPPPAAPRPAPTGEISFAAAARAFEAGDYEQALAIAEAGLGRDPLDNALKGIARRAQAKLKASTDQQSREEEERKAKLLEVFLEKAQNALDEGDEASTLGHLQRILELDPEPAQRSFIEDQIASIKNKKAEARGQSYAAAAIAALITLLAGLTVYYFLNLM